MPRKIVPPSREFYNPFAPVPDDPAGQIVCSLAEFYRNMSEDQIAVAYTLTQADHARASNAGRVRTTALMRQRLDAIEAEIARRDDVDLSHEAALDFGDGDYCHPGKFFDGRA